MTERICGTVLAILALSCGPDPETEAWLCPIEAGACPEDCAGPIAGAPLNHAAMCVEENVDLTCIGGSWGGTGIPTCVEDSGGTQYRIGFGNPLFYEMGFTECELPSWSLSGSPCP